MLNPKILYLLFSLIFLTGITGCSTENYQWNNHSSDTPILETPFGDFQTSH